jgi:hypothetical protein
MKEASFISFFIAKMAFVLAKEEKNTIVYTYLYNQLKKVLAL